MASSNNSTSKKEAKSAMDRFKTEVASELGVNLKEGYNGDLTSREAGSVGGEMVKRMISSPDSNTGFAASSSLSAVMAAVLGVVLFSSAHLKISFWPSPSPS